MWLDRFEKHEQAALIKLLKTVVYLSEDQTRDILVTLNSALLQRLNSAGIRPQDVIYVQVHDAGSSSPVILNLLKDYSGLQKLGCSLVDSKDGVKLSKLFQSIEGGAVVYVDDFAGTGNQLCKVRDMLASLIPTTFIEFVLMPAMCEEAHGRFATRGIEAYTHYLHSKGDRPLLDSSTLLDQKNRRVLQELTKRIVPPTGLGYEAVASNIVLYRNAPNTIPAILRGSRGQAPYPGIFPRAEDFPPIALANSSAASGKAHERLTQVKNEPARVLEIEKGRSKPAGDRTQKQ